MVPEGRTERLILSPLDMADAPQIQERFPHWEIVRYLLKRVPWPYPADGALQYCKNMAIPQMKRGDGWHWSLRLRTQPDQLIGILSLVRGDRDNRGFWLGLPWQGHGLMSEACVWANDQWFDVLGFPVLRVSKSIANTASRRISEKHGMRVVATEEREYVSGCLPSELWELTAEEWHSWKTRNAKRKLRASPAAH